LGYFLRLCRDMSNISLDVFLAEITYATGQNISKSTLSELERGNSAPKWDTLSILASSCLFKDLKTDQPLTTTQLFEIACQSFDPFYGDMYQILTKQYGKDAATEMVVLSHVFAVPPGHYDQADQIADQKGSDSGSERIRKDQKGSDSGSERIRKDRKSKGSEKLLICA
jgi:transcriptional regulator with XRE-family HTH domain